MKRFTVYFLALLFPFALNAEAGKAMRKQLLFEENVGQVKGGEDVRFVLRGKLLTYYFTDRGYSIVQRSDSGRVNRTDFLFSGNTRIEPEGLEEQGLRVSYYVGNTNAVSHQYNKVIFREVTTGVDMEFSMSDGNIMRKLIAWNGNFPEKFSLHVKGSTYWPGDGRYNFVNNAGRFEEALISSAESLDVYPLYPLSCIVGYRPGIYFLETREGRAQYATTSTNSGLHYLGGGDSDELFGIALTADEGAVVTGRTASLTFPSTPGSMQDTLGGSYDAIVTRFDSAGNCLWSTYYGGTFFDGAYGVIALDSGFAVCGMTNSADLPMLNAPQDTNAGSYDAFVILLDSAGQLVRSSYYGGTGGDQGLAIAKGPAGEIVLAGSATSTDLPFTAGSYQPSIGGMIDAFLAVMDPSTLQITWSTYYGGANVEDIHSVTVTPQGEIAFCGGTRSFDFPVTPDAWQNTLLSQPDVYLVKFSMSGARTYATYFGGTNNEDANGVVADSMGRLYITGFTYSIDFPTQGTIFQPNLLGQNDVFVSCFDSTGQLAWSTYIGGGMQDVGWNIFRRGRYIYLCGQSESSDFPVTANAIQGTNAGNSDAYVVKMDTLGGMVSATFMGGAGVDVLLALTVDSDTNVIACGNSYSTDLPVTPNAFQPVNGTQGDGFVVKFGMAEQPFGMNAEEESVAGQPVNIYPNPANEIVTIAVENEKITSIEIMDAAGRLVMKKQVNAQQVVLDVRELEGGIYFVRVTSEDNPVKVARLIKQ